MGFPRSDHADPFQTETLPRRHSSSGVYTTTENPLVDPRFGLCQFSIRIDGSRDRVFQAQLVPQPPADWIGESRSYGEGLEVWELASETPPNLLISQPLALGLAKRGGISEEAMAKIELNPRLRHTGIDRANAESVLFNLEEDFLYGLRLTDNSLGSDFHLPDRAFALLKTTLEASILPSETDTKYSVCGYGNSVKVGAHVD